MVVSKAGGGAFPITPIKKQEEKYTGLELCKICLTMKPCNKEQTCKRCVDKLEELSLR